MDQKLRDLQRHGEMDPVTRERWFRESIRAGALIPIQVALAAYAGDVLAQRFMPNETTVRKGRPGYSCLREKNYPGWRKNRPLDVDRLTLADWMRGLQLWGRPAQVQALLVGIAVRTPNLSDLTRAEAGSVRILQQWFDDPTPVALDAVADYQYMNQDLPRWAWHLLALVVCPRYRGGEACRDCGDHAVEGIVSHAQLESLDPLSEARRRLCERIRAGVAAWALTGQGRERLEAGTLDARGNRTRQARTWEKAELLLDPVPSARRDDTEGLPPTTTAGDAGTPPVVAPRCPMTRARLVERVASNLRCDPDDWATTTLGMDEAAYALRSLSKRKDVTELAEEAVDIAIHELRQQLRDFADWAYDQDTPAHEVFEELHVAPELWDVAAEIYRDEIAAARASRVEWSYEFPLGSAGDEERRVG